MVGELWECFLKQGGGRKPLAFWLYPLSEQASTGQSTGKSGRSVCGGHPWDTEQIWGGCRVALKAHSSGCHTPHIRIFWFLYSWTVRFLQAETMSYTFCVLNTKDHVLTGILMNMEQGRRRRWFQMNKGDKPSPVGGMEAACLELGWWLTDFLSLST